MGGNKSDKKISSRFTEEFEMRSFSQSSSFHAVSRSGVFFSEFASQAR
jgi:hypothetical protein